MLAAAVISSCLVYAALIFSRERRSDAYENVERVRVLRHMCISYYPRRKYRVTLRLLIYRCPDLGEQQSNDAIIYEYNLQVFPRKEGAAMSLCALQIHLKLKKRID